MIGYKVMGLSNDKRTFISGANSNLKFPAKLGQISMPGNGIYMGNNKEYVLDYYSGLSDSEALITFEFNENDIIFGNTTDRECEFSVQTATIINIEELKEPNKYEINNKASISEGNPSVCSGYSDGKCLDKPETGCDMCASEYLNNNY